MRLATEGDDGWASSVVTLCCTFSKGRLYKEEDSATRTSEQEMQTYGQLLNDLRVTKNRSALPCQHGGGAL